MDDKQLESLTASLKALKTRPEHSVREITAEYINSGRNLMTEEAGIPEAPAGTPVVPIVASSAALESATQQENKMLREFVATLPTTMTALAAPQISAADQVKLDNLKETDVDAWRVAMNEAEAATAATAQKQINDVLSTKMHTTEVAVRAEKLKVLEAQLGVPVTDDLLNANIPKLYMDQLEKGSITFDAFLVTAKNYLVPAAPGSAAAPVLPPVVPNLSKEGGGGSSLSGPKQVQDGLMQIVRDFSTLTI